MPVVPLSSRRNAVKLVGRNEAAQEQPASALAQTDGLFDFDLSGAVRLTGDSAANGDSRDPVVLRGDSERAMRRLIAEFGFPRLPVTIAEFHSLVEYCQMLDTAAGFTMTAPDSEARRAWQAVGVPKYSGFFPQHETAIRLYAAGKKAELLDWHTRAQTLVLLAKGYSEFGNEPQD